jgi:hypothetical protein
LQHLAIPLPCGGEILGTQDFIVLINNSGNLQIFMFIDATNNGGFGNVVSHDTTPVRK